MPAGTWHTTAGQPGESLSVVVVIRAPSRRALWLNLLRHYAGQSPAWRARSYAGWTSGAAAEREHQALATLMSDLGERLRTLPAGDAYKAWLSEGFTTGTQGQYPLDVRLARYKRQPNTSHSNHAGDAPEIQPCPDQ